MKKMYFMTILLGIASVVTAQGVRFNQNLSWTHLLEKAQAENKYLFVDAFTTWCGPCKMMDRDVFTNSNVGYMTNKNFIAVKIQMDETDNDSDRIKSWRDEAKRIESDYKVGAYPCFLFFSPTGELVYRAVGYRSPDNFIELLTVVLDPDLQPSNQLANYREGKKDYTRMLGLWKYVGEELKDRVLSVKIAKDYKDHVLDTLNDTDLLTSDNLEFYSVNNELIKSTDNIFRLALRAPEQVDSSISYDGFATNYLVKNVVLREEIFSQLLENDKSLNESPDWSEIQSTIERKYPVIHASIIVLDGKIAYYQRINDWANYVAATNEKIKPKAIVVGEGFYGDGTQLNELAWGMFHMCEDRRGLYGALEWIEQALELNTGLPEGSDRKLFRDGMLDTRAALLYKLGRTQEAIAAEEEAIETWLDTYGKMGRQDDTGKYREVLAQMRKGEPIYGVAPLAKD